MHPKTLSEIELLPKEFLVPTDVSDVLGCDPHYIRLQARKDPDKLGFPVVVLGSRTRIPKQAFIAFCKGELQREAYDVL